MSLCKFSVTRISNATFYPKFKTNQCIYCVKLNYFILQSWKFFLWYKFQDLVMHMNSLYYRTIIIKCNSKKFVALSVVFFAGAIVSAFFHESHEFNVRFSPFNVAEECLNLSHNYSYRTCKNLCHLTIRIQLWRED